MRTTEKVIETLENTDRCVFLTGNAGTGKTFTIKSFINSTLKNYAICATTAIAAQNAGGTTHYKLLGFYPNVANLKDHYDKPQMSKKKRIIKALDVIIVDEISMMRPDQLDQMSEVLQVICENEQPFGGKQMIFVGDLLQLPPVVTQKERGAFNGKDSSLYQSHFPISALSWMQANPMIIKLTKIRRQAGDNIFADILNGIRVGDCSNEQMEILNKRVGIVPAPSTIQIMSTNEDVNIYNRKVLDELPGTLYTSKAIINGEIDVKLMPYPETIQFKENARVMLLSNRKDTRSNGDLGTIVKVFQISENNFNVHIRIDGNDMLPARTVQVQVNPQFVTEKVYKAEERKFVEITKGEFTQLPFRLAYAITVHKSQGLTFREVHIDLNKGTFAPGQLYVALSRCKSLEGLTLGTPIQHSRLKVDDSLLAFDTHLNHNS